MTSDDAAFDSHPEQATRQKIVASTVVSEVREEDEDTEGVNRQNFHSSLELTRTVRDREPQQFATFLQTLNDYAAGVISAKHMKLNVSTILQAHPDLTMEISLWMPGGTLRMDNAELVKEKERRNNIIEVLFAPSCTCFHMLHHPYYVDT
jgi:histone deacetylase complex regulatory component SIN3